MPPSSGPADRPLQRARQEAKPSAACPVARPACLSLCSGRCRHHLPLLLCEAVSPGPQVEGKKGIPSLVAKLQKGGPAVL